MSGTAEIAKLRADLAASETRAEAANRGSLWVGGRILRSHERFLFSRHNYSTPLTRDGQNM
jgi:hypothetical protein